MTYNVFSGTLNPTHFTLLLKVFSHSVGDSAALVIMASQPIIGKSICPRVEGNGTVRVLVLGSCILVAVFFMAALWNRAGHSLWFLSSFFFLLSFFFPRLISAVGDWMSTILLHIWCGLSANNRMQV